MTVTWRKQYPKDTSRISDLPTLIGDNYNIVQSAAELEHYSMDNTTNNAMTGYHRAGKVGVIYEGSTSSIAALSTCAGAMAYDTDLGVLKYYSGSAWYIISSPAWSRVRAHLSAADVAVTADASPELLVFDGEDFDGMSEYDPGTGTFTALASGYYLVNANVCYVASGNQTVSAKFHPAANAVSNQFTPSGSLTNWGAVEDYPYDDADNNQAYTAGYKDSFSASTAPTGVPSGSTGVLVRLIWRAIRAGCVCNWECYQQTCPCNATCHGHSCSCNGACYGYSSCSCNATCYTYLPKGGCYTCNNLCYGYSGCTCNYACYGESCTCNTGHTYGTGCGCYDKVHGADAITIQPHLYMGNPAAYYTKDAFIPDDHFDAEDGEYEHIWLTNPDTGLDWTAETASAVSAWGYKIATASAGDSYLSAVASQTYMLYSWSPIRPTVKLHIYIDGAATETSTTPLYESANAATNQTASITSVVHLHVGSTVAIYHEKSLLSDTISAGSSLTNLSIHRLTGPLG